MTPPTKAATELPGQATLLECWRALARLSPGAEVRPAPGTVAAVFPSWAPLNNAIVLDMGDGDGGAELAATTASSLYRSAGVQDWALWVPSPVPDLDGPDALTAVGDLARDTTTLVMHAALPATLRPHDDVVETSIASLERVSEDEPLRAADLGPPDGQPGLSAWVMVQDGTAVATTWSFLHGADCGIYAVETLASHRRRGLARALVEHVLHHAAGQGARTASLQSTAMGRSLYEGLGFQAAGRYEEWVATRRSRRAPGAGRAPEPEQPAPVPVAAAPSPVGRSGVQAVEAEACRGRWGGPRRRRSRRRPRSARGWRCACTVPVAAEPSSLRPTGRQWRTLAA